MGGLPAAATCRSTIQYRRKGLSTDFKDAPPIPAKSGESEIA